MHRDRGPGRSWVEITTEVKGKLPSSACWQVRLALVGDARDAQRLDRGQPVLGQVGQEGGAQRLPDTAGNLLGRHGATGEVELHGAEGAAVQPYQHQGGAVPAAAGMGRGIDGGHGAADLDIEDPSGGGACESWPFAVGRRCWCALRCDPAVNG